MGKIVISENVSLDGVVEDPTGEQGFRHGGWFSQFGEQDREAWVRSSSMRPWGPRRCFSAGAATSISPHGFSPGPAGGQTG